MFKQSSLFYRLDEYDFDLEFKFLYSSVLRHFVIEVWFFRTHHVNRNFWCMRRFYLIILESLHWLEAPG